MNTRPKPMRPLLPKLHSKCVSYLYFIYNLVFNLSLFIAVVEELVELTPHRAQTLATIVVGRLNDRTRILVAHPGGAGVVVAVVIIVGANILWAVNRSA